MISPAVKILWAAAILATVPLKIAAGTAGDPREPERLQQGIVAFLNQNGFAVAPFDAAEGPFIQATAPGCRLTKFPSFSGETRAFSLNLTAIPSGVLSIESSPSSSAVRRKRA